MTTLDAWLGFRKTLVLNCSNERFCIMPGIMPELTKDESMSIVALAEAEARFTAAQKEYAAAREALVRCSRNIQAKMPWLKRAVDFHEE